MTDQEILEFLAAILIQREGGSITIDQILAEQKDYPEFKFNRRDSQVKISLKP